MQLDSKNWAGIGDVKPTQNTPSCAYGVVYQNWDRFHGTSGSNGSQITLNLQQR